MTITTENKNAALVKVLTDLISKCDGETIRHILDKSGQTEYIFENVLRDREILWDNVGCLDNIVELVQRVNFIKEEITGIEKWAKENCIDIEGTPVHEYPLSRYLGNLSEIADLDSDNVGTWKTSYKVYNKPERVILMKEIISVSEKEYVIDGENYDKFGCIQHLQCHDIEHENEMFHRVWVKVCGNSKVSEPRVLECNVTSFSYDDIIIKY